MTDHSAKYQALVVMETQRVKHYLFASPHMRETRGASVILDRLNRRLIADDLLEKNYPGQYDVIYLGGGSGRILFNDAPAAERFGKDVLALYAKKAPGANVTIEVVSRCENGEFLSIKDCFSRGVHATQQQKLNPDRAASLLAGRWIRPCSSCGVGPAETVLSEHGEHYLCIACNGKRNEISHYLYRAIKPGENPDKRRTLQDSGKLRERYPSEFIFTTLAEYCQREISLPQDVDSIAEHSRPSNYIGFIYADGNAMSEAIKRLTSDSQNDQQVIDAYKNFSRLIDQATREAATEAVLQCLWGASEQSAINNCREGFLPAEFILAGGDDLMLMVPADKALDIAIAFIELFQEKTRNLQKQPTYALPAEFADGFTTSAGIVIAHAGYPVSELMELAGELMKLAKIKATQTKTGTLDFIVIHDASTAPIKQRRQAEYTQTVDGDNKLLLTERPYTSTECRRLLNLIRELKAQEIPRNKLKALYPALFQGLLPAQFECRRILARLHRTGDRERCPALKTLEEELTLFPFRKRSSHQLSSYLSELIELYDFIHPDAASIAPPMETPGHD